jgi:DGQHR domain-containing protein
MPAGERDRELEDVGQQMFAHMGLTCLHRLNKTARRRDVDPSGTHHAGENLELDYLIPIGATCLVGEITARASAGGPKAKYGRFREQFDVVRRGMTEDYRRTCTALGVPEEHHRHFRNITEWRAFYILTDQNRFEVTLPAYPNVVVYYKPEWQRLREYATAIGHSAQYPFLDAFALPATRGRQPLAISHEAHHLNRVEDRQIAAGVGRADVYSFDADPYTLLPLARVFRRDDLTPETERATRYQRALLADKLRRIRRILAAQPDFMFPNGILVVLSNACRYRDGTLEIADQYGAVTVLDGQHRLFSYAHDTVKNVQSAARIPVTAIRFIEATEDEVRRYSAITFVEINANQTRIPSAHIDAVNYAVLGRTTPDALAAAVLLRANERAGKPFHGLFRTELDRDGVIQPRTVIKSLSGIFNLEALRRLTTSTRARDESRRRGYEQLFESPLPELAAHATFVEKGLACVEHYFSLVKSVFKHDWPQRDGENRSALAFAKIIAAFVALLNTFISEGRTWAQVKVELEAIRTNVLRLRRRRDYDDVLFETGKRQLPDAGVSANDDFRFLDANRRRPTSVEAARRRAP